MTNTVLDCNNPKTLRSRKPRVLARQTLAGFRTELVVLTRAAFEALPVCAYQRDDETRIPGLRHLENASPLHSLVLMTQVGKELSKLDGHARAGKWADGSLESPDIVWGLVIHCRSLEEVKQLYDQVDGAPAVKSNQDKMFGQMRASGYIPTDCPFFRQGRYVTAVRMCTGAASTGRMPRVLMELALPYVQLLAERIALPRKASPMVVGAALSLLRKYDGDVRVADELAEFLRAFFAKEGTYDRSTKTGCAVGLLERALGLCPKGGGTQGQRLVYRFTLGAMALWLQDTGIVHADDALRPVTTMELSDELPERLALKDKRKAKATRTTRQVKRDAQTGGLGRTAVHRPATTGSGARRPAARPVTLLGLGAAR